MKTKTILFTLIAMLAVTALVFQSCKKNEGKTNQPPTCIITSPQNGQKFIQGETVTITVDATASDGSFTEVRYFIDDIGVSSTTNFPYNYSWNTNDETIGNHTLKATSLDNSGGKASDEISVEIAENTPPTAFFSVAPPNGTTNTNFAFDASGSYDNEDSTSNLQVRWDFDGNGSWDTNWDTVKTQSHQYDEINTYISKLEVKDTRGETDQYTISIIVSNSAVPGTFTDPRDGQIYATIEIGSQIWFAENLNYETTNSWWYDNSSANGDVYGCLYNWDAALNACPSGWHLPSDEEWTILSDFLGGANIAGDKMKETGTAHWYFPNTGATNSSAFSALPGGHRGSSGSFDYLGDSGYWWSSTEGSGASAWYRYLTYYYALVGRGSSYKTSGFSVRCVKN